MSHRLPLYDPTCPGCGQALQRGAGNRYWRHYRCGAAGCGWHGNFARNRMGRAWLGLVVRAHRVMTLPARERAGWLLAVAAAPALAAALGWGGWVAWNKLRAIEDQAPAHIADAGRAGLPASWRATVPPGHSDEGRRLDRAHPLLQRVGYRFDPATTAAAMTDAAADDHAHGLTLRTGCAWGRPGGNPYRGTARQALAAAGLPGDVVDTLAGRIARGEAAERLVIDNDAIVAQTSGRRFSASDIAMTFGMSLCLKTRVNFMPGHTEGAALYEAQDASGAVFTVMVPEVCGNVSLIGGEPGRTGSGGGRWVIAPPGFGYVWEPDKTPGVGGGTSDGLQPRMAPPGGGSSVGEGTRRPLGLGGPGASNDLAFGGVGGGNRGGGGGVLPLPAVSPPGAAPPASRLPPEGSAPQPGASAPGPGSQPPAPPVLPVPPEPPQAPPTPTTPPALPTPSAPPEVPTPPATPAQPPATPGPPTPPVPPAEDPPGVPPVPPQPPPGLPPGPPAPPLPPVLAWDPPSPPPPQPAVQQVPVPGTLWLVLAGLAGAGWALRRRR